MVRILALFSFILLSLPSFCQVDSLLNLLKTAKDTARVNVLIELAYHYRGSDPAKELDYFSQALQQSRQLRFDKGQIRSLIGLGINYNSKQEVQRADSFLRAALVIAGRVKDSAAIGNIYVSIGMTYFNKEDYDTALTYYFSGLRIFEKMNDPDRITSSLNNIANLYYVQKDMKTALSYHTRSLAISRELKNPSKIASSLNNIGMIYRDQGQYAEALKTFLEALEMAKEINHRFGVSLLLNNIGKCYLATGEPERALQHFQEALEIKTELGDTKGIGSTYTNIGDAYFVMKQYDRSLEYYLKCVELSKKLNVNTLLSNAYRNIAEIYDVRSDFKNAYRYQKLYTDIRDSILNEERTALITEMDAKYQSEKKDKALLQQEAELKVKESESRQKETQRNAILIGFILLALLALVILKSLRDKQKANARLSEAYGEIELKNRIVEEKNKNITDSINYARRIQSALLPSAALLKRNLSEYFVLYLPKDIVSGDFYWVHQSGGSFLVCTGDCTGHGVPGAFMSLLSISSLNEIVIENKVLSPDLVLSQLRDKIIKVLNPEDSQHTSYEGMDCSLCKYDLKQNMLEFSTANNGLWIVSDGTFREYKGDKQPVGYHADPRPFVLNQVPLQKNDCIYTYTDGFADQFGGKKGKKFKYKQLQQLILEHAHRPMAEQKELLEKALKDWKGDFEQVDDILLIGIRI